MTHIDRKTFFTALGFLAVLMRDGRAQKNGAVRVTAMARVIEMFCRTTHLDLFFDELSEADAELDKTIESLKNSHHVRQLLGLTSDPTLLPKLYDRLFSRHRAYSR